MSQDKKLDKKYRPKQFEEVIGQEGIVKVLRNSLYDIESKVVPSIFFGPFGSGKTTLARIFARAILCQNRTEKQDPCNICESCQMFFKDTHPGYTEIDGANLTKVEDFRKVLESTAYQVAGSQYRVFLIDECHMMSKASQNLFLKPLEEGIPGVFWFFCTTEYNKIIETIQSRCTDFGIRPIPTEGITQRVIEICKKENIPYEEEAVQALVTVKKSHFRDVLVFLGQVMDIGGLTSSVVYDYLDIGVNDLYFEVLSNLNKNPSASMESLDKALTRVSAQDAYNGLASAAMDSFKAKKGIRCSLVLRDKTLRDRTFEEYGDNITSIANYLINKGSRRIDSDYLISTLLLMRERLVLGLKLDGNTDIVIRETTKTLETKPTVTTDITISTPATPTIKNMVKSKPLTNLDDKAKKKPSVDIVVERVATLTSEEHTIMPDREFSLLFQRGFKNG